MSASPFAVKIPSGTTLEMVSSWRSISSDIVEFQIARRSSFQICTEGFVPGILDELQERGCSIRLLLEDEFEPDTPVGSFFQSLAGYAFAYAADSVLDSSGRELLGALLRSLWHGSAVPSQGAIGDGKRLTLVCREPDSPIPRIFWKDGRASIPRREDFQHVLRTLGQQIGVTGRFRNFKGEFLSSRNEDQVATFLYEAFRNVQDHVIPKRRGAWGIIVEKLIVDSLANINEQRRIPDFLRGYLTSIWNRKITGSNMLVVSMGVSDFGPGIPATLPPPAEGHQSPLDAILRAFNRGVSRKVNSGSPFRGQGLPNILDAAKRLDALLIVASGGQFLMFDGSRGDATWEAPFGELPDATGTFITMMWQVRDENADQGWLPLFQGETDSV